MPVKLLVTDAKQINEGLWEASVEPEEVRLLGPVSFSHPGPSVLLLTADLREVRKGWIELQPLGVAVLNAGTLSRVIIVEANGAPGTSGLHAQAAGVPDTSAAANSSNVGSNKRRSGDAEFVSATPPNMRPLANRLVTLVRREFPGELLYKQGSGRFVETPDNWWTVKPQPVAKSFRFTVRASVRHLNGLGLSKLTQDRNASYAAFVMKAEEEIPAVLTGLRRASQNRRL